MRQGERAVRPDWIEEAIAKERVGRATKRVIGILRDEPRFASYASTAELAERAEVNAATVVRAAQQLGFSGWPALRVELRSRYLASLSAGEVLAEHTDADSDPVRAALHCDQESLQTLSDTAEPASVRAIAAAMHTAKRTLVLGSGTFAAPGIQLSHAAGVMGYDVVLRQDGGTTLVNDLSKLGEGDCLVVCDLWRLPRAIRSAGEIAAERAVTIGVITDRRDSPLVSSAAYVVHVPSEGVGMFPSLTAAIAIVHALLAELARLGGARALDAVRQRERLWEQADLF